MAEPRVWLVGEMNPYQVDPSEGQRYALYPAPARSAGWRLCRIVLGMEERDYLRSFERRNLLHQSRWSIVAARAAMARLTQEWQEAQTAVVFLGRRVFDAFAGCGQIHMSSEWVPFRVHEHLGRRFVALPHPSGLSMAWNEPGSYERARSALAGAAPHLRPLLGRAEGAR